MKIAETKKEDVSDVINGVKVTDPYRWLESKNTEVDTWVENQDESARKILEDLPATESIKKRLTELHDIEQMRIPIIRKGRYFFRLRKPGQDMAVLYVKDGIQGTPHVLIDPNTFSKDKTVTLSDFEPSEDGKLLLYSLSQAGNDKKNIKVLNVDTGEILNDEIPAEVYPDINCWDKDNKGFWYIRHHLDAPKGEEKLHRKVYWHTLGANMAEDILVFGDQLKKEDWPWVRQSEDGRYLFATASIYSEKTKRTEMYLFDFQNKETGFFPIIKNINALFFGGIHRGHIYVRTDYQSPLGKIMRVSIEDVSRGIEAWQTIIPEGRDAIEQFSLAQDSIFVETIANVSSRLTIFGLDGNFKQEIKLPTLGSISTISCEREEAEMFFNFSSYTIPLTIYHFDLKTNISTEYYKTSAPFDQNAFTVEQKWCVSKDGTKIPMFLVHKKGLVKNSSNPTLVYGYGGFEISTTPVFESNIIPFLEGGGIYVDVNIRGGGEFGDKWHEGGMLANKQNSFDDFIAAIESLIKEKYTSKEKVAIFGWSNGGLLTSTVITQRPDLVKAAVIGAPVADMMRYQLFDGGKYWAIEYGLSSNPDQFKYLIKYSPYHNTKPASYPATLILTADRDDRVHPMHAYKLAAILQENNTSDNPILLRVERKAGHGGAAGVANSIEQYGDMWGFLFSELGITE